MSNYSRNSRRKRKRNNQASQSKFPVDKDEKLIDLMRWMRRSGYRQGKNYLRPHFFDNTGRGLMTTSNIAAGDVLISIPNQLIINKSIVLNSYLGPLVRRHDLSGIDSIILYIICEKHLGSKSFWFDYIAALPSTFSNFAYFTDDDVSSLSAYSKNLYEIKKAAMQLTFEKLRYVYEELVQDHSNLGHKCFFKEFRWAFSVVNTRCLYFNLSDDPCEKDDNVALVPFLDLLNHSSAARVSAGYNKRNDCYEIRTLDTFKRYQQVFINYGHHDNQTLLLEYGFILRSNPHESVNLTIEELMTAADSLTDKETYSTKLDLIRSNNFLSGLVCTPDGLSWSVWTSFSILLLDHYEMKLWTRLLSHDRVSESNREKAVRAAKILLKNKLKQCREFDICDDNEIRRMCSWVSRTHVEMLNDALLVVEDGW